MPLPGSSYICPYNKMKGLVCTLILNVTILEKPELCCNFASLSGTTCVFSPNGNFRIPMAE